MCENCWTKEIGMFPEQSSWLETSANVSEKLEAGFLSYNSINNTHSIYQCTTCSEFWKVQTPDEFPGGYLLKTTTTTQGKTTPSTILIVIVIGVLALLFAKLFQYIFG